MDLKPCPFCGGEPYFDHDDDGWTWIECDQCSVATNQRISAMEDCKPLLAEAWNRRAIPTEPRTCETCATGCLPNERVYVNPDVETPCPGWTPRSPQSADVETVRDALESLAHAASCGYAMSLKRCNEISGNALAALDRLAGKEE